MLSEFISTIIKCAIALLLILFLPKFTGSIFDFNDSLNAVSSSDSNSNSTKIGLTPLEKEKANQEPIGSDKSDSEKSIDTSDSSDTSPSSESPDPVNVISAFIKALRPFMMGLIAIVIMIATMRYVFGLSIGSGDYSTTSRREATGSGQIVSENGAARPVLSVADALESMITIPSNPSPSAETPSFQKSSVIEPANIHVKKEKVGVRVIRDGQPDNVQEKREPERHKQSRRVIR